MCANVSTVIQAYHSFDERDGKIKLNLCKWILDDLCASASPTLMCVAAYNSSIFSTAMQKMLL